MLLPSPGYRPRYGGRQRDSEQGRACDSCRLSALPCSDGSCGASRRPLATTPIGGSRDFQAIPITFAERETGRDAPVLMTRPARRSLRPPHAKERLRPDWLPFAT